MNASSGDCMIILGNAKLLAVYLRFGFISCFDLLPGDNKPLLTKQFPASK